jgi:hypothetical protein
MPEANKAVSRRRALLASAAMTAPAAAASVNNSQTAPGPHPAWFAEWRALVDWCNGPDADGDGKMQDDLVT